jgi:coenzyme F420 hydrogenase subunit beta
LNNLTEKGDPFTGIAIKTFLGRSAGETIYTNSQSGGIVSALLISLMQRGEIKGAVVVSMEAGYPPRPMIKIAETEEEIISAQKSKYCPVPLLSAIEKIKNIDYPIAFVGLPCHIHGLYNIFDVFPELEKTVKYKIGLICGGTMGYTAMDYLLSKTKKKSNSKWSLTFRDKSSGGYPGNVKIVNDGEIHVLPFENRLAIKDYFTPARCRICFDKMNVLSDITLGDPWGVNYADHKNGDSVCIARNARGLEIINQAMQGNMVSLREIDYNEVVEGQKICHKKEDWKGYMEAWIKMGNIPPNYYDFVNGFANKHEKDKYLQKLNFALSIDNFENRDLLVSCVNKELKKQAIFRKLLFPARVARKISRHIKRLLK